MAKRGRKPKTKATKKKIVKKAVKKPVKKPARKEDKKQKEIRIVNIVVSGSLDKSKIPLEKMAATLPNTEYNPEQFPGLVLRIREPKTSALIFNSGKIVCTGARSMEKVDEAMKKIVEAMKKIGIGTITAPAYPAP